MTSEKQLIGLDIGGTKCAVTLALYDGSIHIQDKVKFDTESARGPEYALHRIEHEVDRLIERSGFGREDIYGIGISCGGPLDSKRGRILSPPNLPGWDDIPIVERFTARFGIRTAVQNDANACALAEWKWGAGQGLHNMIFLTFGTGMGAGLILNDRLYSGTSDMAGEVGHLRLAMDGPVGFGKAGSFEGFCSGGGIALLGRSIIMEKWERGETVSFCPSESELHSLSTKTIAEAAEIGDPTALAIFRTSGHYLGHGLSLLIDILNPEAIVIGSIFTRQRDLLWPEAERIIQQEALSHARTVCRILPAALGEQIADYASLSVALNMAESHPGVDNNE